MRTRPFGGNSILRAERLSRRENEYSNSTVMDKFNWEVYFYTELQSDGPLTVVANIQSMCTVYNFLRIFHNYSNVASDLFETTTTAALGIKT